MFFFAEVHHSGNIMDAVTNFQSNLVNWLVLAGLIVWGWNKIIPAVVEKRAKRINEAIDAAEKARAEAEEFLATQKARVENAEAEAEKIIDEAKVVAEQMKKEMQSQTEKDIESLKQKFDAAIANERQVVITETRKAAVRAAMQLSESYLRSNISDGEKKVLMNQFIEQLDQLGDGDKSMVPGQGRVSIGSTR